MFTKRAISGFHLIPESLFKRAEMLLFPSLLISSCKCITINAMLSSVCKSANMDWISSLLSEGSMFVVAGLGNPGLLYKRTRHNAGFQALDVLAEELNIRVSKRAFSGEYGEGSYLGERVVLVKPTTYMNLSGDCIQQVLHFYKCPVEHLVVLYDDIELPAGSLRIREKGSAGTHNGMRSIIGTLGNENFPRVRIGVGGNKGEDLKKHVLGKPGKEDQAQLTSAFCDAAQAVRLILEGKLQEAQAKYNKRHIGGAKAD